MRHPNVASVFHLGKSGDSYFYAMEFVEGETLENFIRRSGKLEVRPALEIATQVAAGLAAVHKQKLVHRDIKPSNIMVNVEEGSTVRAKIIDLGLAKPAPDAPRDGLAPKVAHIRVQCLNPGNGQYGVFGRIVFAKYERRTAKNDPDQHGSDRDRLALSKSTVSNAHRVACRGRCGDRRRCASYSDGLTAAPRIAG